MSLRPCPLVEEIHIRFIALIAAVVVALIVVPTATSASMSVLQAREHRQVRSLHARHGTIVFFRHHKWLARTHPGRVALRAARIWVPILRRELHETRAALRPRSATGYPPHHALWVCISRYEGSPTSVNPNGHYGMLQMTYNWMHEINGAASNYPQAVQEWAAERAWAANGYSYSFLYGQWYAWDNADGCGS